MKYSKSLCLLIILAMITLAGCAKSPAEISPTEETLFSQVGSKTVDPASVGQISGVTLFEGTAPEPKVSSLHSFGQCAILHAGKVYKDDILIQNGKLQNAFIYVKEGLEDYSFKAPVETVLLDQVGCLFAPHVLGIQVNQTLDVKNSDVTFHNVHSHPTLQEPFNIGIPVQGMILKKTFDTAEVMIKVTCDIHAWMKGYIGVLPHPHFAVSGADGTFTLPSLPPGEYVIEVWHEVYGTQTQSITISPNESKQLTFTFKSNS